MINSYTILAMKLNWFAFLRAFYRRSSSQTKPTIECFFNTMKDISGYEWLYAVTEDWKVWSYSRKWSWWQNWKWLKIIRNTDKFGHCYVFLHFNGKIRKKYVHRLVADAFLQNKENFPVVMHINNDTTNNSINNIKWWTHSENAQQSWDEKRRQFSVTQKERIKKLFCTRRSISMMNKITWEYIIFKSVNSASKYTNICRSMISRYANRNSHKIYIFKYL